MTIAFRGGTLKGALATPPSKSHTHRAFLLAAMADGTSRVSNALCSDDTEATLRSCEAMGATVTESTDDADRPVVVIAGGGLRAPDGIIDVGNSGTTLRLLTGIVSVFDKAVELTGDESIRKRPMGPLLDALGRMGVECGSEEGRPPVTVKGPNRGGYTEIDGSVSSQFISSLMMTAPLLAEDTEIVVNGRILSDPYLDITGSMMSTAGAVCSREGNVFRIKGGTGYSAFEYRVPADFSSAAFPLVGAAIGGTGVTVTDLDLTDPQGDRRILDMLRLCGASVEVSDGDVTVSKGHLKALDLDMGSTPDLFPIVSVLLSTADGTSRLHGAPQLRHKESDRIESTVSMLKALGADAEETADGCIIRGRRRLAGGHVETRGDHRILMSAAIASLVCDGPVTVEDDGCYSVSYPDFPESMERIGLRVER
ncbi:MAG: 3-phosphoshikimate 1-carboxyvinyltransferase [Euryarchaeota archaeon]|jgi:3-phosphoshikimate 1-carboxyvinyltransferase|nr:3-phosphoshikimate 1-carboxyvinyltransferase [Euryarchaeota archaeon]